MVFWGVRFPPTFLVFFKTHTGVIMYVCKDGWRGRVDEPYKNGLKDNSKTQEQLEREIIRETNKTSRYHNISKQKLARS